MKIFEKATSTDAAIVAQNARYGEALSYRDPITRGEFNAVFSAINKSSAVRVIKDGERPIAIAGYRELGPGVALAWLIVARQAGGVRVSLGRHLVKLFRELAASHNNIIATVDARLGRNIKFAKHLGFVESPRPILDIATPFHKVYLYKNGT